MKRWEDKRKRLQLARERAGYRSARQAALMMGWTYPTYASHENGLRDFPQKIAERYARAFRVSPEWIMFGTNPPEWAEELEDELEEVEAPTRSLRMFSDNEAEPLRSWMEKQVSGPTFFITDLGNLSANSIAIKVTTDEMRAKPPAIGEQEIKPGDTVIVDLDRVNLRPGEIAAMLIKDDSYIHLRKVIMSGGELIYSALNRDHGEFKKGEVIGKVTWIITSA